MALQNLRTSKLGSSRMSGLSCLCSAVLVPRSQRTDKNSTPCPSKSSLSFHYTPAIHLRFDARLFKMVRCVKIIISTALVLSTSFVFPLSLFSTSPLFIGFGRPKICPVNFLCFPICNLDNLKLCLVYERSVRGGRLFRANVVSYDSNCSCPKFM